MAAGLPVGAASVLADAAGATQPAEMPRLRDGSANSSGIHPFRVKIPNDQLAALRRQITATRYPSMELVADRSQGVQLATTQALARFWVTKYDWRACEARLKRAAAVQDRDRRPGHPPHPRALAPPGRAAAGRVRPGAAVDSRLRLLGRAEGDRLGHSPYGRRRSATHSSWKDRRDFERAEGGDFINAAFLSDAGQPRVTRTRSGDGGDRRA
jgi:hypothetical protein